MNKYALTFSRVQLYPSVAHPTLVYQARVHTGFENRVFRLRQLIVSALVHESADVNVNLFVIRRLPTLGGSFTDQVTGPAVAAFDPEQVPFPGVGYFSALSAPTMLPSNMLFPAAFYSRKGFTVKWAKETAFLFTLAEPLEIVAVPTFDVDVDLSGTIEVQYVL